MSIAQYIDHTNLKNNNNVREIYKLCEEAFTYQFAAVCIPPYYIQASKGILKDSTIKVATVIGFPFGYSHYHSKMVETVKAIEEGADEIDMVMNICALRNNDLDLLKTEAKHISGITSSRGIGLKIIIESGILTNEEIIRCCELYRMFPVQFLKTSTGYAEKGATTEAVVLMRQHLPEQIQIKASGGIRDFNFARQLIDAGASRLGCSASVAIVNGEPSEENTY